MAGNEERTEQATPKRRKDARDKGQVAKSAELNAAVGLLAGLLALRAFATGMVDSWRQFAMEHFARASGFEMSLQSITTEIGVAGGSFLKMAWPVLVLSLLAGVVSNVLQSGFVFTTKTLVPDFSRLNPLQGFGRMFSGRALVDTLKAGLKAAIIGYLIYAFFRDRGAEVLWVMLMANERIGPMLADLGYALLLKTALATLIIAGIDYGYQRYQFEKSLRMTKQEIKEEHKQSEGDPQIKARARQRQREISRNRMMADIAQATVVVTNPTHLAIALRYVPGETPAPQVVAKGQRLIAERIKRIARKSGVPVIENKPVARALYKQCRIGEHIPPELYHAVAEIIAFVFKQAGTGR